MTIPIEFYEMYQHFSKLMDIGQMANRLKVPLNTISSFKKWGNQQIQR